MEQNKKNNNFAEKILCLYFIILPIYNVMKLEFGIVSHFIIPILFLILMIINRKNLNYKYLIYIISFFILCIPYSLWGYKEYTYNWLGMLYLLFFNSLPWFIIGNSIKDITSLREIVKKRSLLILISNIILILYCYIKDRNMFGNMEISYSILPLAIFSFYNFFKDKKIKHLMYATIATLIILILGSRGTILCIAIFILLYSLFNIKRNMLIVSSLIIFSIMLLFNYNQIIDSSIQLLDYYGMPSRTLIKLREGEITNDNGRKNIQEVTMEKLDEKPLLGLGLGVERIYINDEINNMMKDMTSSYPHNLIIEILAQFGYFMGGIIIIYLTFLCIMAFLKAERLEKDFIIIFFSMEIIRLMFSSSYLLSPLFFLLLGKNFNIVYRKKEKVNETNINFTK